MTVAARRRLHELGLDEQPGAFDGLLDLIDDA
jgi:hypothetical protein